MTNREELKKQVDDHHNNNNHGKPPTSKKQGCLTAIGLILVISIGVAFLNNNSDENSNSSQNSSNTELSQRDKDTEYFANHNAHQYKVVLERELSHGARTRFSANIIAPTAETKEDIFGTSAKAVKDLQLKHRVQVAHINMLDGEEGPVLYSITYAPDKKGWEGTEFLGHHFVAE